MESDSIVHRTIFRLDLHVMLTAKYCEWPRSSRRPTPLQLSKYKGFAPLMHCVAEAGISDILQDEQFCMHNMDVSPDSHSRPTMGNPVDVICCAAAGLRMPPAPAANRDESNSRIRPSLPAVACAGARGNIRKSPLLPMEVHNKNALSS